jgi:3-methylfumaryl-CoA hydratase
MLFRFSALTFNGHRIHYDRAYAMDVEGYPGLVVHGPLTAMLLMDLCRRHRPDSTIEHFSFRAMRPIFDTAPFHIAGTPSPDLRSARLWGQNPDGTIAMEAEVRFAA